MIIDGKLWETFNVCMCDVEQSSYFTNEIKSFAPPMNDAGQWITRQCLIINNMIMRDEWPKPDEWLCWQSK